MTTPLHDHPSHAGAPMRATNADRERTSQIIHAAAGVGMLSLQETEERLSAVYASTFRHELDPLVADLQPAPKAGGVRDRLPQPVLRLLAVLTAAVSTVVAFAARHRALTAVVLVLLVGVVLAGAGAEMFGGEEHEVGKMMRDG